MANFHTNNLVIAADEANMQKVLTRFAQNLAANSGETGFDISSIDGMISVKDLYRVVSDMIDAYYWLSFSGAPIDHEVAMAGSEAWGAHPENEAYLSSLSSALSALAARANGGTTSVSFAMTGGAGRPMSDTASVGIDRFGENWVITVDYSTAWRANSDDIDLFFMGLPAGDYGVAFLDADEYDQFEDVTVFVGLHHGRAGLRAAEIRRDDVLGMDERKELKSQLTLVTKSLVADPAELAEVVGICGWSSGWEDEDEYEDEEDYGYGYSSGDPLSPWGYGINWNSPSPKDLSRVDEAVIAVIGRFPWVVGSTGAAYEGRERNAERVVPGQPIKLVSDWVSPYFSPAAIQTRTASGERLGNLDDNGGGMELSDNARAALACMLQHVRAYADKVEPLMTIDGRRRNSTLIVRLEMTDEPLENVLEEVHSLLKEPSNGRSVSSVVEGEE